MLAQDEKFFKVRDSDTNAGLPVALRQVEEINILGSHWIRVP